MNVALASLPILLVIVAMLACGLPAKRALPLGWAATLAVALGWWRQNPLTACTMGIGHVCGCGQVAWKWNWGWNPGLVPFVLVCCLTFFLHRMPAAKVGEAFMDTFRQIRGAAGNMICVNNIVAVCATTGVSGNEGRIIRVNLLPCLLYCLIVITVLAAWA